MRPGLRSVAVVRSTLLLASVLVLGACSSDSDGPTSVDEDFRGTWVNEEGTEYYVISGSTLEVHIQPNAFGCFAVFQYDLEPDGGNTFTATDEFEETYEVVLERDGPGLALSFDGVDNLLSESDVDTSELEHCGEQVVDCDDFESLSVPDAFDAFLSTDDIEDGVGAYLDVYSIEVGVTTNFQVSMSTSAGWETWLGIYDEEGFEVHADPGDPHSSIQVVLPSGCYFVIASSNEPAMTGAYTITTSTF